MPLNMTLKQPLPVEQAHGSIFKVQLCMQYFVLCSK